MLSYHFYADTLEEEEESESEISTRFVGDLRGEAVGNLARSERVGLWKGNFCGVSSSTGL